ncbi:MAG: hypothetical protein ABI972_06530 [Acidobacteriota bacterium]
MNRSNFAAGILALMGCLSLGAQSIRVTATIPFDFRVGKTLMPAGNYMVTHDAGVLWLKTNSGPRKAVNVLVRGTQKGSNGGKSNHIVFNRYGEDYFLSQVFQLGEPTGLEVPKGKIEKEMIAGRAAPVQTASVNLRAQ